MKFDEDKKKRLRDRLPVVDIADGVRERMKGREWFRVCTLARKEEVSTSTILNRIKSGKLEGCSMCGVIHARKPLPNQGRENEETEATATVEEGGS